MFRDDSWPYTGADDALALTTLSYNPATGEIYDADIELNTHGTNFTLDEVTPPIQADFQSIMTHEVGHFLGLDHSRVGMTTMREHYDGTLEFRSLDPDDIAGVCAIYPPGRALSGKCEPRHGFSGKCGGPEVWPKEGCGMMRASQSGSGSGSGVAGAALALALVMGLRRWKRA
jgi:hypothetical protein